jgi:hypothetical protein
MDRYKYCDGIMEPEVHIPRRSHPYRDGLEGNSEGTTPDEAYAHGTVHRWGQLIFKKNDEECRNNCIRILYCNHLFAAYR